MTVSNKTLKDIGFYEYVLDEGKQVVYRRQEKWYIGVESKTTVVNIAFNLIRKTYFVMWEGMDEEYEITEEIHHALTNTMKELYREAL